MEEGNGFLPYELNASHTSICIIYNSVSHTLWVTHMDVDSCDTSRYTCKAGPVHCSTLVGAVLHVAMDSTPTV